MNRNIVLIIILSLIINISLVYSQDDPRVIQLIGTIYDQSPARNPDFEIYVTPSAVIEGIVLGSLDENRRPVYCCGDNSITYDDRMVVHNSTTFSTWFVEDPTNIPMPIIFNLTERTPGSNIWEYFSDAFFPIDGRGFDNSTNFPDEQKYVDRNGTIRNYHFCISINYQFTYRGGEFFTFAGDDDVWVFFDNRLLIDLGGLHYNASKTVYIDDIFPGEFIPGQDYPFDFFYCERQTLDSNLNIIAQFDFICAWYDECGVCEGLGDTCCIRTHCPDPDNKCVISKCDESTNFQCQTEALNCTVDDECLRGYCEDGICYTEWICGNTTDITTTGVTTTGITTTGATTTGVTTTLSTTGTPCPIIIEQTPKGLRKGCLTCQDLNCPSMGLSCSYYKNQIYSKDYYEEGCEPDCCEYSPTCSISC